MTALNGAAALPPPCNYTAEVQRNGRSGRLPGRANPPRSAEGVDRGERLQVTQAAVYTRGNNQPPGVNLGGSLNPLCSVRRH